MTNQEIKELLQIFACHQAMEVDFFLKPQPLEHALVASW